MIGATWTSHLGEFKDRNKRAQEQGLVAAANVVRNAVMQGLRGGYTSGDFVTGRVMNSVRIGDPGWEDAMCVIRVGTDVDYALFWELGHHNIFTHKYERVEVWRPALTDTRDEQARAYSSQFKREMA